MRRAALLVSLLIPLPVALSGQEVRVQDVLCAFDRSVAPIKPRLPLATLQANARDDSNDAVNHYELALGYWSQQRLPEAEKSLRVALSLEPHYPQVLLALAHLPYACRPYLWARAVTGQAPPEWRPQLEEADREGRLAFLLDPLVDPRIMGATMPQEISFLNVGKKENRLAIDLLGGIYAFAGGQFDWAQTNFAAYVKEVDGADHPERVPGVVLWYRGLTSAHQNRFPEAIVDIDSLLQRALRREAGDSLTVPITRANELRYVLAVLYDRAGQAQPAAALYQEAAVNDLGLFPAHSQLARLAGARGDWETALAERRRAIDANPEDPVLQLELGITLLKAERPGEALAPLGQAQEGMPRNYRVAYYQGVAAASAGDVAAARQAFQRFLALVPSRFGAQIEEVHQRLEQLH